MDPYNALHTLPVKLLTRKAIFDQIAQKNKQSRALFFRQWFGYGKEILSFYKTGLTGIWRNRKEKAAILSGKYHYEMINYVSKKSENNILKGRFTNSRDLTDYLLNECYLKTVEKKPLTPSISRSEYQTVLRTEKDIKKLPLFGLLFVIFEELTPIICLAFPKVVPSTCILPALYSKEIKSKSALLEKQVNNRSGSELVRSFLSQGKVHDFSSNELAFLHSFFGLGIGFFKHKIINDLQRYRSEILVDFYLMNGQFSKLNDEELERFGLKCGVIGEREYVENSLDLLGKECLPKK